MDIIVFPKVTCALVHSGVAHIINNALPVLLPSALYFPLVERLLRL